MYYGTQYIRIMYDDIGVDDCDVPLLAIVMLTLLLYVMFVMLTSSSLFPILRFTYGVPTLRFGVVVATFVAECVGDTTGVVMVDIDYVVYCVGDDVSGCIVIDNNVDAVIRCVFIRVAVVVVIVVCVYGAFDSCGVV